MIGELKQKISNANEAYRSGKPFMSDDEYDALLEKLQNAVPEDEYNEFRNTLNEGVLITSDKKKIKHPFVVGSLDKLKYEEPAELEKFIKKCLKTGLNVSAKIDGLSGIIHYKNGKLMSLGTRGDGYEGEDITDKARYIKHMPQSISTSDEDAYVRGELVILHDDFENVVGTAARNAVSGLIGRKDWRPIDIKNITFVAYTVLGDKLTKDEQFKFLDDNGFMTAEHIDLSLEDLEKINEDEGIAEHLFAMASKSRPYDTDGLVISDKAYRNEDEYRPEMQRAFKINQMKFETKLIDIEWQGPQKNGAFVPVGILEPVDCNGVIVSRCTLHNIDFIEEKELKLGSVVNVVRSGDVIPKLLSVVSSGDDCVDIEYPKTCTCCGSALVRDGVNFRCMNKSCRDQTTFQVCHFIRKFDVESANFKTLQKFNIFTIDDLLAFKASPNYKSEMKLESELKSKVFTQSKEALLAAMNFNGIGETIASKIIAHFGYDNIKANPEVVLTEKIDGIGNLFAQKFLDDVSENIAHVEKIISDVRYSWKKDDAANAASKNAVPSRGSMCFTGVLSISRSKASKMATEAGFEVKSSVTRGLTYLVTNDVNSGSSKNKKAKQFGTKVISEEEFMTLVSSNSVESDVLSL